MLFLTVIRSSLLLLFPSVPSTCPTVRGIPEKKRREKPRDVIATRESRSWRRRLTRRCIFSFSVVRRPGLRDIETSCWRPISDPFVPSHSTRKEAQRRRQPSNPPARPAAGEVAAGRNYEITVRLYKVANRYRGRKARVTRLPPIFFSLFSFFSLSSRSFLLASAANST